MTVAGSESALVAAAAHGHGVAWSAAVLSVLPQLVYWKDLEGRYLGTNETYRNARGLTEAEMLGRTEQELPVRDAFTGTLPPLERAVIVGGVATSGVQSLARQGESSLKVHLSVVPLRTPSGKVTGVVGVGADVTGLSDLDRKLSHASRLESIGRLAAGIAHQINTPVQFITDNTRFVADGMAELLRALQGVARLVHAAPATPEMDAALRQELTGLLEGIDLDFLDDELPSAILQSLEGLSQIAQIVSGLKGFSRSEGEMGPLDLNRAIDNAVQLAGPEWLPLADLRLALDPELGEVTCFEGEVRQVLLNLILNAAQAVEARRSADPGYQSGLIEIITRRESDQVVIEVRDDGIGMDEATRARIFDPFFTTKDLGQATGQGLSLAYTTIVSRHRGGIEVHTAPMAGAVFTITLPARPGPVGC